MSMILRPKVIMSSHIATAVGIASISLQGYETLVLNSTAKTARNGIHI